MNFSLINLSQFLILTQSEIPVKAKPTSSKEVNRLQASDQFQSLPIDQKINAEAERIQKEENLYFISSASLTKLEEVNNLLKIIELLKDKNKSQNSKKVLTETKNEIEQRIKEQERAEKLIRKRAEYNLTKEGSHFNEYLPYRCFISNDQEKLREYENLVELIRQKADMKSGTLSIDDLKKRNFDFKDLKPIDPSREYLIAASIVELLHNRPDLIEKVLSCKGGFKIRVLSSFPYGGMGNSRDLIILNNKMLCYTIANPEHTPNSVVHEFIHVLDASDRDDGRHDGFLDGMDIKYWDVYLELTIKHNKFKERLYEEEREQIYSKANEHAPNPATGIPNYAFTNEHEFIAETVEFFLRSPSKLKKASPQLYDIYCKYFKYDPLELRNKTQD